MDKKFKDLLEESVKIHGHLCPGQVLGVRMSLLGLGKIGIEDPKGRDRKSLIVYVEIDRCATDAVQSVTGCSPGKRTLKLLDYGKMAATFVNLKTGKVGTTCLPDRQTRYRAVRILAKEGAKDRTENYCPEIKDKYQRQTAAYKVMPDDELFQWENVTVEIPEQDMPGRPLRRIKCDTCGEYVQDRRDLQIKGKTVCKACAYGTYYAFEK